MAVSIDNLLDSSTAPDARLLASRLGLSTACESGGNSTRYVSTHNALGVHPQCTTDNEPKKASQSPRSGEWRLPWAIFRTTNGSAGILSQWQPVTHRPSTVSIWAQQVRPAWQSNNWSSMAPYTKTTSHTQLSASLEIALAFYRYTWNIAYVTFVEIKISIFK